MPIHGVKQGEHLSRIAEENGFSDFQTIWDDPNNAELKQQRKNPNVLFPGDELFIPEKEIKEESGATDERHRFRSTRRGLSLKIVLKDAVFKPLSEMDCVLEVEGESFELITDANGLLQHEILRRAGEGRLRVPEQQVDFELNIGSLDPVEERSGQMGRFNNLGYTAGTVEEQDEQKFKSAVEEFQCDNALKVDGVCGSQTQAKLKEVHGC